MSVGLLWMCWFGVDLSCFFFFFWRREGATTPHRWCWAPRWPWRGGRAPCGCSGRTRRGTWRHKSTVMWVWTWKKIEARGRSWINQCMVVGFHTVIHAQSTHLAARSVVVGEVPALRHEALDDAVECRPLEVQPLPRQRARAPIDTYMCVRNPISLIKHYEQVERRASRATTHAPLARAQRAEVLGRARGEVREELFGFAWCVRINWSTPRQGRVLSWGVGHRAAKGARDSHNPPAHMHHARSRTSKTIRPAKRGPILMSM